MLRSQTSHVSRLDALLDRLIRRKDIHSVILSVASGDGAFQWAGARGVMSEDGTPVTPTTPWFIASITKLFIASTVMRLVEEGELALDDRVVDRLPGSVTDRLHVLDGEDRTNEITVEHLLAHASGLPDYIEDIPARERGRGSDRRSLVQILLEEGDRAWSLEDTSQRVRERLKPHFAPQPLNAQRVRIRYSDTNYQLLIGIIEACRDAPFFKVVTDLILDPLKLEDTWFPGHFCARANRSSVGGEGGEGGEGNSDRGDGGREPEIAAIYAGKSVVGIPRFLASISDMNSSCDDLLGLLKAMVSGQLFRDRRTWRRMQARWHSFPLPLDRAALRQPSWPIEYGLGVMRFSLPGFLTPMRSVPLVLGHTGSTGTWLFHAPKPDLYMTGTVNQITAGAVPFRVVPEVLRAIGTGHR